MKKNILFLILLTLAGFLSCYDGVLDSYDDGVVYKIGDKGPAGGSIFYINLNYKSDGWRYMEVAPTGWYDGGTADPAIDDWTISPYTSQNCPGVSTELGTGYENTIFILAQNGNAACPAKLCRDYQGGGMTDWFMPSKDELHQLYLNKSLIGSPTAWYWSSSDNQSFTGFAWYEVFSNGYQDDTNKWSGFCVRPIRCF